MAALVAFAEATHIMLAVAGTILGLIVLTLPLLLLYDKIKDSRKKKNKRGPKVDNTPQQDTSAINVTSSPTLEEIEYEMIEVVNRGTQVDTCELYSRSAFGTTKSAFSKPEVAESTTASDITKSAAVTKSAPASSVTKTASASASPTESQVMGEKWSSMNAITDEPESSAASLSMLQSPTDLRSGAASKEVVNKQDPNISKDETYVYRRPNKQESTTSETSIVPERSQATQTDDLEFDIEKEICEQATDTQIPRAKPATARYQPSSNAIICPRIRAHSNIRQEWCLAKCPRPVPKCSVRKEKPKSACDKNKWSWW